MGKKNYSALLLLALLNVSHDALLPCQRVQQARLGGACCLLVVAKTKAFLYNSKLGSPPNGAPQSPVFLHGLKEWSGREREQAGSDELAISEAPY